MTEALTTGSSYEVSTTLTLQGSQIATTPVAKKSDNSAIRASWASRYREKVVERAADRPATCVRRYLTATLERGGDANKTRTVLRPVVQRVVARREAGQSTIFSLDGPLTSHELDLLRAETFAPAFGGLLPNKAVGIGDQWQANVEATTELTGIDPIQTGALNCTVREFKKSTDGVSVRVGLAGTVSGPSEQGPGRQTVEGHFLFDLDHRLISYLVLNGQSEIFDDAGKVVQRLEGRLEVTRKTSIEDPRLTAAALAGLNLKPTAESTTLLFDEADPAIRFLFPRNWELSPVRRHVIQLDEPTGGRLLLTVDPSPVPTAEKLRTDLLAWLQSQKAKVTSAGAVKPAANTERRRVDSFTVRATVGEKEKEWSYFVIRDGDRIATIAANIFAERSATLRKDVDSIARSLEFVQRPK